MTDYETTRRARPSARPVLMATAAAFTLGALAAGYGVWRFHDRIWPDSAAVPATAPQTVAQVPATGPANGPAPIATASDAARQAAQQIVAEVTEQQGGLDQRLAAAEQRIARLDLQSQAAAGNVARAEGLLIAFSARRALDRGASLGILSDQLRLRFADAVPNAVATIVAFGNQPVTLDQLIARLDGIAPELANSSRRVTWGRLRDEFTGLFVVRRDSTPSPQPARRIERARQFLQIGRVDAAIAEVRNLPNAGEAAGWITDARRYSAAQAALDLIETAAVLEPRKLRDGAGRAIEQLSPAVPAIPPVAAAAAGPSRP